jgi:hypothetical protein
MRTDGMAAHNGQTADSGQQPKSSLRAEKLLLGQDGIAGRPQRMAIPSWREHRVHFELLGCLDGRSASYWLTR